MKKKNLLIVDDDSRNIFALTAVLRARSFACESCSGAVEALEVLHKNPDFDAVLLDMMMPEMDGYEALAEIRKIPGCESLPIVAVTAQAMLGDREKCLKAGANAYVSKPIDIDLLMHVLDSL